MRKLLSVLAAVTLLLGVTAVPVLASVQSGGRIVVAEDEVIDDDFFAAGEEVTIEGTINGDVYVGAQRLNIRGTVNGDVLAGATTIEVTGTIRDDLRAGGNTISLIGATIGDSVSVGANELSVDDASQIGGGLIFGGRSLSLSGAVGRGIVTGLDNARIDSSVGGTVRIAASAITIAEGADIAGDLEYNSENQPLIDGDVRGKIIKGEGKGFDLDAEVFLRRLAVGFTVWAFAAAVIVGGVLLLITPRTLKRAHERFAANPWPTAGWGTLVWLATIPAVFVLMLTVFGIPLALLILAAWLTALYLAKIFVGFSVGQAVLRALQGSARPNAFAALVVGLALYYGLRILPYVGFPVRVATTVVGLGMIASLFSRADATANKKAVKGTKA